jgi:hypothetical protein
VSNLVMSLRIKALAAGEEQSTIGLVKVSA